MTSIKFQSLEDGELADIWYALGGSAARHPNHFQPLMDEVFAELESRRKSGGREGNWFRATPAWQDAVVPLIEGVYATDRRRRVSFHAKE